jgi:hypothetical protein
VSLLHCDLEDAPFLSASEVKDFSRLGIYAQATGFQKARFAQEVLNEAAIGRLIDLQGLGHRKQDRNVIPIRDIGIDHDGISKLIATSLGMATLLSRLAERSGIRAITGIHQASLRRKLDDVI